MVTIFDFPGIVHLIAPIHGPQTQIVRLHINTKSRNNVLIAHNLAIIEVYVSRYYYWITFILIRFDNQSWETDSNLIYDAGSFCVYIYALLL
jgi:hypothetical protein